MICLSFLMMKSVSIQTLVRQSQEMTIRLSSLSGVKYLTKMSRFRSYAAKLQE